TVKLTSSTARIGPRSVSNPTIRCATSSRGSSTETSEDATEQRRSQRGIRHRGTESTEDGGRPQSGRLKTRLARSVVSLATGSTGPGASSLGCSVTVSVSVPSVSRWQTNLSLRSPCLCDAFLRDLCGQRQLGVRRTVLAKHAAHRVRDLADRGSGFHGGQDW